MEENVIFDYNENWESKDLSDNYVFCFQRCVCVCAHRLTSSSKLLTEAKIFYKLKTSISLSKTEVTCIWS